MTDVRFLSQRIPVVLGFFLLLTTAKLVGQDPTSAEADALSPTTLVDLSEGIQNYIVGRRDFDAEHFEIAIELFDKVLSTEPSNTTAMLYRSLSHGGVALEMRLEKRRSRSRATNLQRIIEIRLNPELLAKLKADLEKAKATVENGDETNKRVAQAVVRQHESFLSLLNTLAEETPEALETGRIDAMRLSFEQASQERSHYRRMLEDLQALLPLEHEVDVSVRLMEVVAKANIARIQEQHAVGIVTETVQPDSAEQTPDSIRIECSTLLDEAAKLLSSLNTDDLDEQSKSRVRFFLGVIRFRQAVPLRDPDREQTDISPEREALLLEAERTMTELADDKLAQATWRSYASLYLGMIIPFRAAQTPGSEERNLILDKADHRLTEAVEWDLKAGGGQRSTIPDLVWRQRHEVIAPLRIAQSAARQRNDLSLSFFSGVRLDTNVVLLGERTDLPRGVSRSKDFGVSAGVSVDYTLDFADRMTLGVQGRTSQVWNADVHEFDQQLYGGSVALQYALFPESEGVGPAYFMLQYDYDYVLLGRKGFLTSNAITPSLRIYWQDNMARSDVMFTYESRDYSEPLADVRFDRDGIYSSIGVAHRIKTVEMTEFYESKGITSWGHAGDEALQQTEPDFPKRYLTWSGGLNYSWDATKGDEFDRQAIGLSAGVELPLPRGYLMELGASYQWEDYPQHSLVDFHRRARRDLVQQYGLSVSRKFVLTKGNRINRSTLEFDHTLMTMRAYVNYTLDDSNVSDRLSQAIFSYDRWLFGFNLAFTIN